MNKIIYSSYTLAWLLIVSPASLYAADKADEPAASGTAKAEVSEPAPIAPGFSGSYLSGMFSRANGNTDAAIRYLRHAHLDDPNNIDIDGQLQGLLLLEGNIDEAIELAQDIHEVNAQDPVSDLLLTLHDIKTNDMDSAAKIIQAISGGENEQLWVPLVSAWVDAGRKKPNKPMTIESLSANVGHTAPLVYYHLALINAYDGFTEEAAKDFKNAIEDPQNPPERLMQVIVQFYQKNNSPEILKPLVEGYLKSHTDTITQDAPRINTVQDGVAEILYTMGSIMLGADVGQDATIYLHLTLYMKPDFSAAVLTLADAYSNLQQYEKSNEVYGRIPPESPYYNRARFQIALNYDRMGKLDDALSMLNALAKKFPQSYEVWIAKGDLLRQHSRFGDAVTAYSEALKRIPELRPQHWAILFARGASYEEEGKWPLAEADLKKANELKPDQPEVLNYLAYSWVERHEHLKEACDMLQKAVAAQPDDGEITDSLGWSFYALGDYQKSADTLEKAVELMPGDATVNAHLGDAYWRLGRKTEARYQWQRALNSSPEPKLTEELHKKIRDGLPAATVSDATPAVSVPPEKDATDTAATAE